MRSSQNVAQHSLKNYETSDKVVKPVPIMLLGRIKPTNLEIIGEAAKNLPGSLKNKYDTVPWRQISGMRDVLIHEYAGVLIDRVWKVIEEDLLPLKKTVRKMLKELS